MFPRRGRGGSSFTDQFVVFVHLEVAKASRGTAPQAGVFWAKLAPSCNKPGKPRIARNLLDWAQTLLGWFLFALPLGFTFGPEA